MRFSKIIYVLIVISLFSYSNLFSQYNNNSEGFPQIIENLSILDDVKLNATFVSLQNNIQPTHLLGLNNLIEGETNQMSH